MLVLAVSSPFPRVFQRRHHGLAHLRSRRHRICPDTRRRLHGCSSRRVWRRTCGRSRPRIWLPEERRSCSEAIAFNNARCWSEVEVAIWSAKTFQVTFKWRNLQIFIMVFVEVRLCMWFNSTLKWMMLHYSAAWMQIRSTASKSFRFKVHIIKSLLKSKWCNGPIEAYRQRRSLIIWSSEIFQVVKAPLEK